MGMSMEEGRLYVGWSVCSITPDRPVGLEGQFHRRISEWVQSELTVTVLAVETRDERGGVIDQMMWGACDLVGVNEGILRGVREALDGSLPGFELDKLILSATHTHTGPCLNGAPMMTTASRFMPEDVRPLPEEPLEGVMTAEEYSRFLVERLCEAFREAWRTRAPGWAAGELGQAVLGHNRRVVYDDGSALMYGSTDSINYCGPEGAEDHGVELLYFWDEKGELTGVVVNPACPSQVVEGHCFLSADYWGEARRIMGQRGVGHVHILPLCGAAGDQSPRDMVRRGRGEPDMRQVEGAQELGRRVTGAVMDRLDAAKTRRSDRMIFGHGVLRPDLPVRTVTRGEQIEAGARLDAIVGAKKPGERVEPREWMELYLIGGILDRYETQQREVFYRPEIHILRLGDAAMATNPFEFFIRYGLQIKAGSRAVQTLVVQLACDYKGYLPTAKAARGGHYSAFVASGLVGPEGGKVLVDRTVEAINAMWPGEGDKP